MKKAFKIIKRLVMAIIIILALLFAVTLELTRKKN